MNPPFKVTNPCEEEMERLLSLAAPVHYEYVKFLTGLGGVMLSLSAPLQNDPSMPNPLIWSGFGALLSLTISVIAGALALYGEKMAIIRRLNLLKKLCKKNDGNLVLTVGEYNNAGQMRPHGIHRLAFNVQWVCFVIGVILLLLSKAFPVFHPRESSPLKVEAVLIESAKRVTSTSDQGDGGKISGSK